MAMQLRESFDKKLSFWTEGEVNEAPVFLACEALNEPALLGSGRERYDPVMFCL